MDTTLGEQLRSVRIAARLSQDELAELARVNRKTVMGVEAGRSVQFGNVQRIMRALGVTIVLVPLKPRRPTFEEQLAENRKEDSIRNRP
jgi:transcriptional regulator with XRE-family HTH domain